MPRIIPSEPTNVGAYEAKTKFSELIARAEKGERFVVTKNGRPVARIEPSVDFNRDRARQAAQVIRELATKQGPMPSAEEAQKNYEEHKGDIEREWDERLEQWLRS